MLKASACLVCLLAIGAADAGGQTTDELNSAGWKAVQSHDGDTAASAFRQALAMRPRDPVLYFGAGVAAHLQGREPDAVKMLQKALELEPRLVQAAALLGEIAYHQGDLDLAIKTYETAIAKSPPSATALGARLEAWRSEASVHSSFATVKDDRFAVMFEGPAEQQLAIHATRVLGNAFWYIGKRIGQYPSAPIKVILYTNQQFRDITGAPEWAGGGYDGQIRVPVRGALQRTADFDRVLVHELTHAILRQVASRNLPTWLNEGLAMHFEGHDAAEAERFLTRARVYVPLKGLSGSFTSLTSAQATVAYYESMFATSVLSETIGPQGIGQLLQDLDRGEPFDQAIQRFGFTLADFESGLIKRIGRR